jgi:acetyl-CoA acyltransferase
MNIARIAALLAGLPDTTCGMTLNRFCSSGLQSIALACENIALGQSDAIVAGGIESMSLIPMGGHNISANPALFANNNEHIDIAYGMGITAEKVAAQWKVSREAQDAFALQSHERAITAIKAGHFKTEITPVSVSTHTPDLHTGDIKTSSRKISQDEGPRVDTSLATLAKLRPAFDTQGTVTAGNSSQVSDGAGACLVVSKATLKKYNLKPLAQLRAFAIAGVPPEIMGIGPVHAIPKALKQAGLTLKDIGWIELNEAFSAQSLAVINELKLDPALVNPLGGAIALGHPLGATGTIRTATLLHGMRRNNIRYGMVTMCIGTGMGAAAIFEVM